MKIIEEQDKTNSGTHLISFILDTGREVIVDIETSIATRGNYEMKAGEYRLLDGNILVINDNTQCVETKEASIKPYNQDHIGKLKEENKQLREALQLIINKSKSVVDHFENNDDYSMYRAINKLHIMIIEFEDKKLNT